MPLAKEVMEAGFFAAAYEAVQEAQTAEGMKPPSGPMVDAVMECFHEEFLKAKEARERHD